MSRYENSRVKTLENEVREAFSNRCVNESEILKLAGVNFGQSLQDFDSIQFNSVFPPPLDDGGRDTLSKNSSTAI